MTEGETAESAGELSGPWTNVQVQRPAYSSSGARRRKTGPHIADTHTGEQFSLGLGRDRCEGARLRARKDRFRGQASEVKLSTAQSSQPTPPSLCGGQAVSGNLQFALRNY